jgi:stage II sporulation protein D
MSLRGHGVGMSGCGAKAQAKEGKSAEQILQYYYKGVRITERE